MKITSIPSQMIINRLNRTSSAISENLLRLASGLRVNRPSDDVVSFSIAGRMESKIRGLSQAINAMNSSFSALETASSSILDQIAIVAEMKEIAEIAADPDTTDEIRQSLQSDMQNFLADFETIANNANFLGIKLLDGSVPSLNTLIDDKGNTRRLDLYSTRGSNIFRGQRPTGEFESTMTLPGTGEIQLADVTGDGNLDRIAYNGTTANFDISFGDGSGGFTGGTTVDGANLWFQVADMNGDGTAEIVTADAGGGVTIFEYDGNGNFTTFATFSGTAGSPQYLNIGDLTNNGFNDILVRSGATEWEVFENDGEGGFTSVSTFDFGYTPNNINLADLDGDGVLDIVGIVNSTGEFKALLNDGAGNFSITHTSASSALLSRNFVLGDATGDGIADVITYNNTPSGNIQVWSGNGDGTFSGSSINSLSAGQQDVKILDYNQNGVLDLLIVTNGNNIVLAEGNGAGSFTQVQTIATGVGTARLATGDLNGDGLDDFIARSATIFSRVYEPSTEEVNGTGYLQVNEQWRAERTLQILEEAEAQLNEIAIQIQTQSELLEFTVESTELLQENTVESRDRLLALDEIKEEAELAKNQILQEAQLAALTQANFSTQLAIELLKAIGPQSA